MFKFMNFINKKNIINYKYKKVILKFNNKYYNFLYIFKKIL